MKEKHFYKGDGDVLLIRSPGFCKGQYEREVKGFVGKLPL